MSVALLFPGQGSQAVGMGRELAESSQRAREAFERADEVLGFGLSTLCWHGPEETLQLTENTQPAILTTSVAVWRELEARGLEPVAAAGHSLGEYSALVAAGSLAFEDALRLVRRRGQLMQEAVPVGLGAMAAILALDEEAVAEAAAEAAGEKGEVCTLANLNAPGQIVIAGGRAAVERAAELARERGARRAVLLPVSAPFHCPLMAPAREGMKPLLEGTDVRAPRFPVVCNVDAEVVSDPGAIRDALIRQIDSPVRWVECVQRITAELAPGRFLEVGFGGVLSGLQRRIDRGTPCSSVSTPAEIDSALAQTSGD